MPWVSLWLFFYEIWVVTGEWLGGGHDTADENEDDEQEVSPEGENNESNSNQSSEAVPNPEP